MTRPVTKAGGTALIDSTQASSGSPSQSHGVAASTMSHVTNPTTAATTTDRHPTPKQEPP